MIAMNARTCQLCGKPLSRFAVGSGGDFCSREHRNQYRLRLGMDRLMEADKVASLMRRRENAKQISTEFLLTDYNIAPRSYPPARIPAQNPSMDGFKPTPAGLFVQRLPNRSDKAAKLGQVRVALAARPRSLRLAMSGGRNVIPLPPRSHKLSVEIPQSRKAIVRDRILKPGADPREFGILRHPPLRVHIGSENHKRYSIPSVGAHSLKSSQRTHTLRNHPVKGKELRVSASAGFRLPEPVRPAIELAKPGPVAMPFSKRAQGVAPPARKMEAGPRHAARRITKREMVYQPPTMGTGAAAFLWPNVIPSAACDLRNAEGVVRCSTLRWNTGDPLPPGFRPHEDGAGFSRSSASLIASRPGAASMESAQRLTLVAFEPQDNTFEYTPRALHGSLMGGVPFGAPQTPRQKAGAAAPAAAPPLEEHFDNGWAHRLGTNGARLEAGYRRRPDRFAGALRTFYRTGRLRSRVSGAHRPPQHQLGFPRTRFQRLLPGQHRRDAGRRICLQPHHGGRWRCFAGRHFAYSSAIDGQAVARRQDCHHRTPACSRR